MYPPLQPFHIFSTQFLLFLPCSPPVSAEPQPVLCELKSSAALKPSACFLLSPINGGLPDFLSKDFTVFFYISLLVFCSIFLWLPCHALRNAVSYLQLSVILLSFMKREARHKITFLRQVLYSTADYPRPSLLTLQSTSDINYWHYCCICNHHSFLCPHPHPQQVCFAITSWQTIVHRNLMLLTQKACTDTTL